MWTSQELRKIKYQAHKLKWFKVLLHTAVLIGPQQKVNSILAEINFNISENVILLKCPTLVVLRYICERGSAAIHGEEAKKRNK
jgi:hypothetical protein